MDSSVDGGGGDTPFDLSLVPIDDEITAQVDQSKELTYDNMTNSHHSQVFIFPFHVSRC